MHYQVVRDYSEISNGQQANLRETEKSFGNMSLEFQADIRESQRLMSARSGPNDGEVPRSLINYFIEKQTED